MDSDLDLFVNFDSLDGGKDDAKSSSNFIGSLSPDTAAAAAAAMSSLFSSVPPSTSAPSISPPQWPSHFHSASIPQSTDHLTLPVAWPTHLGDASTYDLIDNTTWHHKPHTQHQASANTISADTARASAYVIGGTEARGLCGGVPSFDQSPSGADAVPRGFLPSSLPTHRHVQGSESLRHGIGGSVFPQRSGPASSNVGRCQAEGIPQLDADEEAQWRMFLESSISSPILFDAPSDSTNAPATISALVSDSQYNAQQQTAAVSFPVPHPSAGYLGHPSPPGTRIDVGTSYPGVSPSQSSFPTANSSSSERLLYPTLTTAEDIHQPAVRGELTQLYPSSPQNIPSGYRIHRTIDRTVPTTAPFGQTTQSASSIYATNEHPIGLSASTSGTHHVPIMSSTPVSTHVSSVSPPSTSFPQFTQVNHVPQGTADATQPSRRRGLIGWMPNQPQPVQPPFAAARTVSMGATMTPPRRAQLVAPTLSAPQPASRTATAPIAPSGLVMPAEQYADVPVPEQLMSAPHRTALGGFPLKRQTFSRQEQAFTFPPRPSPLHPSSSSPSDGNAFVVNRGHKRTRSGSTSSFEVASASGQHIDTQDFDVQTIATRKPRRESKSRRLTLGPDSDSEMGHNDTDGDDEEYKADGDEEDSDDYFPSRSPSPPRSSSSRRPNKSSRGTHSPSVIPLSAAPSSASAPANPAGMYHQFGAGATTGSMDRNRSSSSGGTQGSGSGSGSGKRSKGKARGSAAYALAVVTQRSMQSSASKRIGDTSPNASSLDAMRISSTSPSSPIFDLNSIDLENHPSIRKRKNHPIPLPVPVPNLNKKSRGRKVPFVLKVDQTGSVEFPEGVAPASSVGPLESPFATTGDQEEEDTTEPVVPTSGDAEGGSHRPESSSSTPSRRPSSTHSRRKSVTPAPLLSGGEGDRTFVCVIPGCGKCFVRGEHLKRHVRSIHTHDKPHVCPYEGCDKTFSRRDNLGQHVRIHLQQQS